MERTVLLKSDIVNHEETPRYAQITHASAVNVQWQLPVEGKDFLEPKGPNEQIENMG